MSEHACRSKIDCYKIKIHSYVLVTGKQTVRWETFANDSAGKNLISMAINLATQAVYSLTYLSLECGCPPSFHLECGGQVTNSRLKVYKSLPDLTAWSIYYVMWHKPIHYCDINASQCVVLSKSFLGLFLMYTAGIYTQSLFGYTFSHGKNRRNKRMK